MATSGTIDTTVIRTAKVLEHAIRRCGLPPTGQTPEIVDLALENLFLLLLTLANRGINLWCLDKRIVGLKDGQATYVLPPGTIDVLNLAYSKPTRATGTDATLATSVTTTLADTTKIVRLGVKLSSLPTTALLFEYSSDALSWTTAETIQVADLTADVWTWIDVDPAPTALYYRISSATAFTATEFYLASVVYDILISQFNRDDYANQPNKTYTSSTVTNYYFEKLLNPQITCWPVPNNDYDQISVWRHRQVQDIGTLTQEIEIPNRWFESVIWQLAERLAFELPGVQPDRLQAVSAMSDRYRAEAEGNETDSAPVRFAPAIGVYTR